MKGLREALPWFGFCLFVSPFPMIDESHCLANRSSRETEHARACTHAFIGNPKSSIGIGINPQSTNQTTPQQTSLPDPSTFTMTTPLDQKPPPPPLPLLPLLRHHWLTDLHPNIHTEIHLLLLTFSIGLQNATSYAQFHCFASAQTGNTAVLALALADPHNSFDRLANTTVSLVCWLAGALVTGQVGNFVGRRRRIWQVCVGGVQTLAVFGSAWVLWEFSDGEAVSGGGVRPRIGLGLLAAACGSQIAAARAWGVPEISTAMATACWVDLLIDRRLFGAGGYLIVALMVR